MFLLQPYNRLLLVSSLFRWFLSSSLLPLGLSSYPCLAPDFFPRFCSSRFCLPILTCEIRSQNHINTEKSSESIENEINRDETAQKREKHPREAL
ncbi:hypothetical protein RchiOBHm_Chr5g0074331 [Rosa chinensis]|uniref:Secreted protein n=1 Tax=Rosa chinensis TaxID=74649 RepID=A0A2P6QL69_ROSCH|nr:hypothetical protein RchiOBHm_Chr5g0074331 [Rosa chinensis]